MNCVFWFFIFLVFYVYLGYPIILKVLNLFFARKVSQAPYEPSISIILSAFNEEKNIEQKLFNLLNLDYPENKVEILVGSDGASDQTDAIISRFYSPRIRFFRFVANQGKAQVLNSLIREAHGSILVLTDARQKIARDAVRALMTNFHDPQVGSVSGELHFEDGDQEASSISKGMKWYWWYEKALRRWESNLGSMLGATGALYAVRRRLISSLPNDILVDDMYIPLSVIDKGYRAIFDTDAHTYDKSSSKGQQEFKRKVRTLAGNYQIFSYFPGLLNPLSSPIAWQLISHKLLRLLVPFFLVFIFLSNAFLLQNAFYRALFFMQIFFYGLALFEFTCQATSKMKMGEKGVKRKTNRWVAIPYTFCLLNYSALMGLIHYLFQKNHDGKWEKAYA